MISATLSSSSCVFLKTRLGMSVRKVLENLLSLAWQNRQAVVFQFPATMWSSVAFTALFAVFAAHTSLGEPVELSCSLDTFHLIVKKSSCSCTCDGASVSPQSLSTQVTESALTGGPAPTQPGVVSTVKPEEAGNVDACQTHPNENLAPVEVDDFDRVDCFPENSASEQGCVARGCIWKPSTHPNGQSTGAPWCYRPESAGPTGYLITRCSAGLNGNATYSLIKNNVNSAFSTPWADVRFDVEPVGDKVLRLKLYDKSTERYEVPVPLNRPATAQNPEYEIHVFREPLFYFKVIRRSTGAVIFDTSLAGLILEDQYIQIKTRVATDKIYGFGENRHRSFKHKLESVSIPMWTKDSPPTYHEGNHYGFHPYYMVVENDGKAHGVLLHTSSGMEYKFGSGPTLTYRLIGGVLDFYFVLGDNPEQLTQEYTALVGRPFLPPYWSLGFQLSRWGYNSLPRLQQIINRNKAAGVPQDVQTLDIDYMRFRQNFVVDHDKFNGLEDYVETLKDEGIRTIIILDPAIHSDAAVKHPSDPPYRPYLRGLEQNVYIKWPADVTGIEAINVGPSNVLLGKVWPDGRTAFPDFFTNRTKTWWTNEIKLQHDTLKFDGLWIDMNEVASFGTNTPGPGNWYCGSDLAGNHTCIGLKCPANRWENPPYTGRLGRLSDNTICMSVEQECRPGKWCKQYDVHNLYGWSQSEPTYSAAQKVTGKRSVVVSRSTYPGNGKHVGHWLGDNAASWGDLQYSIVGMMEFNLFGIPYIGADICGFFNEPSEELCARWQQLGAFYPYSRNHNGNHFRDQDPAQWPQVAEITKKALAIRYRLLPYLYTLFYKAHVQGSTVIRPLHHEFLNESVTYDINDQFLWGSGLMIAPVVNDGQRSRDVYFPNSEWYNYDGQREISRQTSRTVPMELDQIGVYFRGGVIFPAQSTAGALNTKASRRNPFQFVVALNGVNAAEGEVYWDDGESIDPIGSGQYLKGKAVFFEHGPGWGTFNYTVEPTSFVDEDAVTVKEIYLYGWPYNVVQVRSSIGSASSKSLGGNNYLITVSVPLKQSFKVLIFNRGSAGV